MRLIPRGRFCCSETARLQPCRQPPKRTWALAPEGRFSFVLDFFCILPASVLLLAFLPLTTGYAQTSPPGSLKSVLVGARARVEKSDVRATGHLVQVSASGTRINNTLALASHSFPDGLRTLITVTTPSHASERYLLTQNETGRTTIEVLRSGSTTPEKLSPEHWAEGVAGTLFSPEDFADGQFFWARQTVLPAQKYGARDCFVLKSEPGPGQPTVYASVTTFIDQKTGAPVYIEAMPKSGPPAKQFVFYSIEQLGGMWLSRQIEAKIAGQAGSSLLLIDHGSPHAHLLRKDFSLSAPGYTGSGTAP